ncbi:hypothetical protein ACQEU8_02330 [Streptomyces sp. CA-250714]|uniref:hypothetical protein n=1 Tax=Streptomyces sp. CA-250714 TaxID=3240060 RepID=UPI003D92B4D1
MRYHTHDGGTVEAERRGYLVDLHVRDAAGRTIATVEMGTEEASALLRDLDAMALEAHAREWQYDIGYRDGVRDTKEARRRGTA